MKRIIFLFSTLLAVNIFACEGAFHETLQEVKALHYAGYQNEASTLMHELLRSDIFNFSGAQIECYNTLCAEVYNAGLYWYCTNCEYTTGSSMPRKCPKCKLRGTFVRGILAYR